MQPKDEVDYFDINVINNTNNDIKDVWTLNPQNYEGNTGQWLQGRVQIEASGDPEYQVTLIIDSFNLMQTTVFSKVYSSNY